MATLPVLSDFPLADADRCDKCGLCLPHCPSYVETRHEGDSPRGRIALMQGLATGLVPQTAALEAHLDGCLNCRACEAVCPAQVPYGRLIDAGRAALAARRPERTRAARVLAFVLTNRIARSVLVLLLLAYRALGIQALLRRGRLLGTGRLARLESLAPSLAWRALRSTRRRGDPAEVALFTNCTSSWAERETLIAAVRVLEQAGVRVAIPARQGCCGALHLHAGLPAAAEAVVRRNVAAFAPYAKVLGVASGCTAELCEYGARAQQDEARAFSAKVQDIHAFLLARAARLKFRPLAARVAIHTPCTLKNVLQGAPAVAALLRKIPALDVVELDAAQLCCGAAGSAMLLQPDMADRLLERKLDAVRRLKPDFIVSANVGCSLHFAAGLRRAGLRTELLHPVALLARQLEAA